MSSHSRFIGRGGDFDNYSGKVSLNVWGISQPVTFIHLHCIDFTSLPVIFVSGLFSPPCIYSRQA